MFTPTNEFDESSQFVFQPYVECYREIKKCFYDFKIFFYFTNIFISFFFFQLF